MTTSADVPGSRVPAGEAGPDDSGPSDSWPCVTSKGALRREVWARRRAADLDAVAALGAAVAAHGVELVRTLDVRGPICTYEAWPVEPPTAALNAALAADHELLVPITLPDRDLDWQVIGTDRPLGPHTVARADLVLAPGTLVDASGTRLGQGGGCYDRALPRRRPGVPVVVVLFDDELIDAPDVLPRKGHDEPVDAVLRPSGVTWLR